MVGERPVIGVSACLLGEKVRFDGGHKLDHFVRDGLGACVDLRPWCPEVAIGLGLPRAPIRLTGEPAAPRAVGVRDPSLDVTARLHRYAEQVDGEGGELCGYVFKKGSPSCGMERVKVYSDAGMPVGKGSGQYAARLMALRPLMPCEEEGRFNDPPLRESFVERVYVYHRWQRLRAAGLTPRGLVDFHTRHKYLILSHAEREYRQLGRMVAAAGAGGLDRLADGYIALVMQALCQRASPKRHANVLQHLLGFLRATLDGDDRRALSDLIEEYRRGQVPLVVPIRFLRYHFRRHPDEFVGLQYYLDPYPDALGVRNHL